MEHSLKNPFQFIPFHFIPFPPPKQTVIDRGGREDTNTTTRKICYILKIMYIYLAKENQLTIAVSSGVC